MKGYEIKQQFLQNNKYVYTALLFTTCALFSSTIRLTINENINKTCICNDKINFYKYSEL